MKNKGFSLIELLVAMAIGAVLLLMLSFMLVQGTKMFNTESDEINLKSDYQIVRNQLEEAFMEAKTIVVVRDGEDIRIYTGAVNTETNLLEVEGTDDQTTERIITYDSSANSIYISSAYLQATSEGNLLSDMVTDFDIEINEDCLVTDETNPGKAPYYVNPVNVILNLQMDGEIKKNMDSDISVRVRNRLKEVAVYEVEDMNEFLSRADETRVQKIVVK